ncbi:MAG TPA: flagellar basal-body rod protein FlgF [Candidatus Angelobacter sp.]|nr:flagellar basal-body rod protein FlgF [Candidatus Angelobacter sp.]
MDSGYYAACTALMARAQALDTIANNLANTSTSGYRGQHNVFQSVLAQADTATSSPLSQAVNSFGVLSGTRIDPTQGTLEHTGNDLDLAIEGPGFFVVQTTAGLVYTRGGNFRVSAKNQLVTAAGDPVLGESGPVTVLGSPSSISPDGTISTAGALSGKLKLVEFPAGTPLQNLGQTYYSAADVSTKTSQSSTVRQGMLEDSNVSPIASVVELVSVQREAEMMQRVLSMINSDLNKVATQDLPRVGA